jgi:type I restriction enzyme S subunit
LAPSFHVSADQEALDLVAEFGKSDSLGALCVEGGLYRGPIFRRIFAPDPSFGRPYVTATDLEQAEVRPVVYLSQAHGELLDRLALHEDTIVVSCSGVNLGKSFYVRPDMDGLVASHDLIRVAVDPSKVSPGYLFAYLDSRFGRSALRQSMHGGSVRHIEPADLAHLPVPRLASAHEGAIHALVFEASRLLTDHTFRLERATAVLETAAGLDAAPLDGWEENPIRLGWGERHAGEPSLRALNYDPRAQAIRKVLTSGPHTPLGELCDPAYFRGKQVFKREEASSSEGVLLLGQRAAFRLRAEGRFISRRSVDSNRLRVPSGTVLIPSHGTLGARELYCRAVVVTPGMSDYAFSGDFFRCVPLQDRIEPGYLYAFLRSRHAFRMLRGMSSGGKQQELPPQRMAELPVPRLGEAMERKISREVEEAVAAYDDAVERLTRARLQVDQAMAA